MFDLEKMRAIFVEEAEERVAELEDGLLRLEKSPNDDELLNMIFRAAHTIKGSGGTLGFNQIAEFTHDMEEILDSVRRKEIASNGELITILLAATDAIKEMVESVASNTPVDLSKYQEIRTRMQESKATQRLNRTPQKITYRITFIPDPDIFRRGIDPAHLLGELKEMGTITKIRALTDNIPSLSEFDPETFYIGWELDLNTEMQPDGIMKVFEFVEDGSDVRIALLTAQVPADTPLIGQILEEEGLVKRDDIVSALKQQKRLGEILVEQGKVSTRDIDKALENQSAKKVESFKHNITSTIRVDLKKLDHLINLVGEMVIVHSMIQQLTKQSLHGQNGNGGQRADLVFTQLQRIGKDIQESTLSLRMLPAGEVFQRFNRLIREIAQNKHKKVELIITGEETELDKGVLERITDPLVHLIRNAIDHGIELPEERKNFGKPEVGAIRLNAYQAGDAVYIRVEDDGRGLNREKILKKAIERGLIKSTASLSAEQIYDFIFMPGFSTADAVTDISGRGVGMDVVKKSIESFDGKVSIRTTLGKGTAITIKIPLTLVIIEGLTIGVGGEVYIIPISSVVESLRPSQSQVRTVEERGEVVNVRGEYLPIIRLQKALKLASGKSEPWQAIVIVVQQDGKKFCLLADEILGQQQVVIKHLGTALPKVPGIAGGTILGDGRVALVFDIPALVETASRSIFQEK